MTPRRQSTPLLILAFVLFWNSGFIGAEYGLPYVAPFTLLFWRYLVLTLFLAGYLAFRRRLYLPSIRSTGRVALVGVLAHGVWLACVLIAIEQGVPAGIVALVVALQPMTTGALSGMVTGERPSAHQWLGLIVGFTGVALAVGTRLNSNESVTALAYLAPFGSVVAITIASLLQRRWSTHDPDWRLPVDLQLLYQSAATTLMMLLPALLIEDFEAQWTVPLLTSMAWLIFVVSLGAYGLMWQLLQRLDATRVASLFYLGPPVTMLMAWIAFGDTLTLMDVIGMLVTAGGVLLVQRRKPAATSAR